LVLSIVIGLALGFAIPLFPWARNTLDPLVDAAYAIPVTMLIPVIGIYVGLGFSGRVFLVFMFVAMIIVVNTSAGVRNVDPRLIEVGRSFGASGFSLWRKVIFPSALTHIASGLSLGVSRAFRAAIAGEILLITAGLGGFITAAAGLFQMPRLFAGIVWTVLMAYSMYAVALAVERRLLRWQDPGLPSEQSGL
jgi:NitT/TauT family transport system permease protein